VEPVPLLRSREYTSSRVCIRTCSASIASLSLAPQRVFFEGWSDPHPLYRRILTRTALVEIKSLASLMGRKVFSPVHDWLSLHQQLDSVECQQEYCTPVSDLGEIESLPTRATSAISSHPINILKFPLPDLFPAFTSTAHEEQGTGS
jgi:hypothetical protein